MILDAIRRYRSEGWSLIPIPQGKKAPAASDWVNKQFEESDFSDQSNIGVNLGKVSGDLVDVDLDVPEAVLAAPMFLQETQRKHGREGTGTSHYWYLSEAKSERWMDTSGKMLVEIRSNGSQTLIPPSVHPTGERLFWSEEREPARVSADDLRRRVRNLATAVLLARHWPAGSRHMCARDLAGFLVARNAAVEEIEEIVRFAATAAGDEEMNDRVRAVRDTVMTFEAGGKTTGGPSLEASVGKDVVGLLTKWHGSATQGFDEIIAEMNEHRFGARVGKDYVYGLETETGVVFQPARSLFEEFANQKVRVGSKKVAGEVSDGKKTFSEVPTYRTKFEIWREHPKKRSYRTVGFWPPPLTCHERDYNLWSGFAITPLLPERQEIRSNVIALREWADQEAKAKCQLYLDMMLEVICCANQQHYHYLLKWMAFTVQQPGTPIEVSVVMKGELGTGKGTFARNFGSLFGRHFTHLDRTEQLAGKFNSAISGKVVVFADEAFFAGDKKDLGSLKRLITEPTLAIERKGIDVIEEANCVHLIMATNNEHAHQAAMKERRFFTVKVSSARIQDHDYFTSVADQMKNGGREALLSYLLTREVTHNDIRKVPMTEELREQQEMSLSPEQRWWKERLIEGELGDEPWPERVSTRSLHCQYLRWCEELNIHRRASEVEFGRRVLKPWLGLAHRQREGNGTMSTKRALLPLHDARRLFDQIAGTTTDWDNALAPVVQDQSGSKEDLPF